MRSQCDREPAGSPVVDAPHPVSQRRARDDEEHAGARPDRGGLIELSRGYRVPNTGATVSLYVLNLFNKAYRNFVGVPNSGRLALLQLKYEF